MEVSVEELLGKTIVSITGVVGGDEISIETSDGLKYRMYHGQDCCESVSIDDIIGDLRDLEGSPITMAEEETNLDLPPTDYADDSYTWTFYKFATVKGYVTIRWFGTSNGYYSESVDFERVD